MHFENIWKTITVKFLRCECLYLVSSLSKRSLDFPLYDCWNVFIKKNKLPSADPSLYINVTVFLTVLFSFWYCVVSFCGMNTDFLQLFSISWVCLKLELLFILHRINNYIVNNWINELMNKKHEIIILKVKIVPYYFSLFCVL